MSARSLIAVTVATVIFGSAGCSSTSDDPGTKTTPASQVALPQCPSAATVTAELGIAYNEPVVAGNDKQRTCTYSSADGKSGNATVRISVLKLASDFDAFRAGFNEVGRVTVDIRDLGDKAFSTALTAGDTYTTAAVKGTLQIVVTSNASRSRQRAFIAKLLD